VAATLAEEEDGGAAVPSMEAPPALPSPAFHFNKKIPACAAPATPEEMQARVAYREALVAEKQGKADQRSAAMHALTRELLTLRVALAAAGQDQPG